MPANFIDFLAQTPDGYLWWPTPWGMGRFDGFRFHSLLLRDEGGKPEGMDGVFCDSQGRLWVWNSRRTLGTIEGGEFAPRGRSAGIPAPFGVFESPEGQVWLTEWDADEGVFLERVAGGEPARQAAPRNLGFETQACLGAEGTLWLWHSGSLHRAEGDLAVPVRLPVPDGQVDSLASMFFRFPGGELGVVGRGGVYRLEGGEWMLWRAFEPILPKSILLQRAAADRLGNVWIGSRQSGLWVATNAGHLLQVGLPGLVSPDGFGIGAVCADHENNVWVGTRAGLYQLRRAAFRRVLDSEPLAKSEPVDVAQDRQGCYWVVTESGLTLRYSPTGTLLAEIPTPSPIVLVEADARGPVWLAGRSQIWKWDDGPIEPVVISTDAGAAAPCFNSLKPAGGTFWAGSDDGLWRLADGRLERESLDPVRRATGRILVHGNAAGQLRALSSGVGLLQPGDAGWRVLPNSGRLLRQDVVGLHVDPESRTWVHGRNPALQRQEGEGWREVSLGTTDLPIEVIALESDNLGELWGLTSSQGVFRLNRDFPPGTAPAVEWFGRSSGLPSIAGRGWGKGISRSGDGRIWVATAGGVAVIDPQEWVIERERSGVPMVHIEEAWLDDQPLDLRREGGIVVPPGGNRLEIRFTALGLNNAAQNRFRYQLEGVDPASQDAGTERSAAYHKLPPGQHRFRVTAANSHGIWNKEGASLMVTVLPAWWQRVAVHVAGWMALIGVATLFYHWRLRQLEQRRALQESFSRQLLHSQEAERKRIAGELHDGLGQNLLVARNLALLGAMKPPSATETEPRFTEIAEALGTALNEVRTISRALRPAELDQLGLTKALRLMLERLQASTGIAVVADVREVDPLLHGDEAINLYRLIQEGSNNVIRHAQATRLQCRIDTAQDAITVEISDNGRGFELTRLQQQGKVGLGLQGMRERARLMGGRMEIDSAPGRGTRLLLILPLTRKTDE